MPRSSQRRVASPPWAPTDRVACRRDVWPHQDFLRSSGVEVCPSNDGPDPLRVDAASAHRESIDTARHRYAFNLHALTRRSSTLVESLATSPQSVNWLNLDNSA